MRAAVFAHVSTLFHLHPTLKKNKPHPAFEKNKILGLVSVNMFDLVNFPH